ncbi:MAG: hypothetical protein ABFD96_05780 [Armatimonadia bacterium]
MPNVKFPSPYHSPASGVDRACELAKQLFSTARGHYDTDAETIRAIARHSGLSTAEIRQLLQPSRRPKDVRLGVWSRLRGSYRRYLERQLAKIEDEIDRLAYLDPDDAADRDLLHQAETLVDKIKSSISSLSASEER